MTYNQQADLVVIAHAGYVAFVVVGQLLILLGAWRRWQWVRSPWFRVPHLLAILIVVAESFANVRCPLTTWETQLRQAGGQSLSQASVLGQWAHGLIFWDCPLWVFSVVYGFFGLLVLGTFLRYPPRWQR